MRWAGRRNGGKAVCEGYLFCDSFVGFIFLNLVINFVMSFHEFNICFILLEYQLKC